MTQKYSIQDFYELDPKTRRELMIDFLLWMLHKNLTFEKGSPEVMDVVAFFNKDGLILGTGVVDDVQFSPYSPHGVALKCRLSFDNPHEEELPNRKYYDGTYLNNDEYLQKYLDELNASNREITCKSQKK